MKKKWFALLLCLSMASTSFLSGCSTQPKESSVAETTQGATTTEGTQAQTESQAQAGAQTPEKPIAEDLSAFVALAEKTNYVQAGSYIELDTLELASQGKLTSCFGNNNGSNYQVVFLPPAPEQDAAKGIPQMNWEDQQPTEYDDPTVENSPANPYFAPIGWCYKLREDETIVMMLELPPECKYFSIGPYLMMTATEPGQDLSYDKYSITVKGSEAVGDYQVIFGSIGDQLNNYRIATGAGEGVAAYSQKAVIVFGGDRNANRATIDMLIESGIDEKMINVMEIPSQTLNLTLDKGGDAFCILGRTSQAADTETYASYASSLPETAQVYRVTPKTKGETEQIPALTVLDRGTGRHEACDYGYATKDLDTIRQAIIDKYTAQGYTYTELLPHISVPEGITNIFNTTNGKGDNRDTSYLSTDYFTFETDEDFVVVYGVNHTATGKALYSNSVLYGVSKLNGVASVYDAMFTGSAESYLADGYHDSDTYYVYKMDRFGTDPFSIKVEYSTDNPKGKYYGLDNGAEMLIAFRAYIEAATGVGPDYNEIVYDRAIVFHKAQP